MHTDTCKIKVAYSPSPRTDGAVSKGKSQKMKLGNLSKIQTKACPETSLNYLLQSNIISVLLLFSKKEIVFPLSCCYHQKQLGGLLRIILQLCIHFLTGTLYLRGIKILIIQIPNYLLPTPTVTAILAL